jgi:putative transposase
MAIKKRKTIRLKGYDYRQPGYYYVTFCSMDRQCIFGEIKGTAFVPNVIGAKINELWQTLPDHFLNVSLDVMQVMPNHVHAIIIINDHFRESSPDPQPFNGEATLGQIVGYWRYQVSKQLHARDNDLEFWQDNMYEHIIRNEHELQLIRQYIFDNPGAWAEDQENPANAGKMRRLTNTEVVEKLLASQPRIPCSGAVPAPGGDEQVIRI